jgi:hypothetical protein
MISRSPLSSALGCAILLGKIMDNIFRYFKLDRLSIPIIDILETTDYRLSSNILLFCKTMTEKFLQIGTFILIFELIHAYQWS